MSCKKDVDHVVNAAVSKIYEVFTFEDNAFRQPNQSNIVTAKGTVIIRMYHVGFDSNIFYRSRAVLFEIATRFGVVNAIWICADRVLS